MATVNGTPVRDVAARRRAAIQASENAAMKRQPVIDKAKKPGLLDALTSKVKEYAGKSTLGVPATSGPMSADAKAIKTRVEAEQQLGDEVGGRRNRK